MQRACTSVIRAKPISPSAASVGSDSGRLEKSASDRIAFASDAGGAAGDGSPPAGSSSAASAASPASGGGPAASSSAPSS